MGRPREFEEADAIERAMLVFWEKGFESASLPQLLDRMGLTRGSFYKAFKGKRAVYLAALAHYDKTVVTPVIQRLRQRDGSAGPERIAELFVWLAGQLEGPSARKGCFLCKAAVDRAPHDRDVERAVTAIIVKLQGAFGDALLDDDGRLRLSPPQAEIFGGHLAATYLGLQVLRNAGSGAAVIKAAISQTLRTLRDRGGHGW